MEHHPEDFHVSALFMMGRKCKTLGKAYSLHLNSGKKPRKIQFYYSTTEQRDQSHHCPVWAVPLIHKLHLQLKCSMTPCHSGGERTQSALPSCPSAVFCRVAKAHCSRPAQPLLTKQIFTLAVKLSGSSVSAVEGLKEACFILYYDVLGPEILNFPPIYQAIYLVIGVETVTQYFCLKTEAAYFFFYNRFV